MSTESVNRFLNSRNFLLLPVIFSATGLFLSESLPLQPQSSPGGFFFESPAHWIANPMCSKVVAILCYILVSVVFVNFNCGCRLVKTHFWICAGLFLMLLLSQSPGVADFGGGTFLLVVVAVATILLFSLYDNPFNRNRLFLIFLIISASSMWLSGGAWLLPIFLIGCIQMKILDFKGIIAMLLGIITPFWIVLGLGIKSFDDFMIPDYGFLFTEVDTSVAPAFYYSVLIAALIGFLAWTGYLVKILTFNAARRAFNGFYTLLFFAVLLMITFNPASFESYLPLLDLCVAFQLAHFFVLNQTGFSLVVVVSVMVGCVLSYIISQPVV